MSRAGAHRRSPGAVALVALLALGVLLGAWLIRPGAESTPAAPATTPTTAPTTPALTDVYAAVLPSMVLVTTDKRQLGTGVVANRNGDVLTAAHVVKGAGTIRLVFADGTKTTATVASSDAARDVATLRPASLPETLVPATIGGKVQVGGTVLAVGNPLGLSDSASSGIVSGIDRRTTTDDGTFTGLIQFDAAVNPGSSGGPLLDSTGSLIGIVVSIADPGRDDSFAGIGFAVPIGAALGGGGAGPGPTVPQL